jgi:hypothetical protein
MALVNLAQKYDPRIVADKERIKQVRSAGQYHVAGRKDAHTYMHMITYVHTYIRTI